MDSVQHTTDHRPYASTPADQLFDTLHEGSARGAITTADEQWDHTLWHVLAELGHRAEGHDDSEPLRQQLDVTVALLRRAALELDATDDVALLDQIEAHLQRVHDPAVHRFRVVGYTEATGD